MLVNKILRPDGGTFYRIHNTDGKVWLMPALNMQVAMNLYQPSGVKGKILKMLFPYLHEVGAIARVVNAEKKSYCLKTEWKVLLEKIFDCKELEFAVFCGTPCVHQKLTIQVFKGKRILGYVKVADNADIQQLFEKEKVTLARLRQKGIQGIPECLYCGSLDGETYIFIQSTQKTERSRILHEWTVLQENFLKDLQQKTRQTILFEDSDYYSTLQEWRLHLDWMPAFVDTNRIATFIYKVLNEYCGKEVVYSAYHADFTPWNMFVEQGKLFVFDWEYARMTYPQGLDRYHFFTQTANFEKHWTAQEIIRYMQSDEGAWIDKKQYMLYLLDVMARFTIREKGKVTGDVVNSFRIWIMLLEYLQS